MYVCIYINREREIYNLYIYVCVCLYRALRSPLLLELLQLPLTRPKLELAPLSLPIFKIESLQTPQKGSALFQRSIVKIYLL